MLQNSLKEPEMPSSLKQIDSLDSNLQAAMRLEQIKKTLDGLDAESTIAKLLKQKYEQAEQEFIQSLQS